MDGTGRQRSEAPAAEGSTVLAGRAPREGVPWKAVALFLAVACGLAWIIALPLWQGDGLADPAATLILPLTMFAPAAATLVACFALRVPPRGGRARFLGLWPLRPAGRTVGFVVAGIFVPPLVIGAVALVSGWLGLVRLDLLGFSALAEELERAGVDLAGMPIQAVVIGQLVSIPLGAIINALFAFGEEIGWRGWLLPALRPLGVWPALILSGAAWGLWHAPVILLGYNFSRPDAAGLLLMVAGCVAWGVLLGWSRLRTGSVWPAVFAHGAINAAAGILIVLAAAGQDPDPALVGPLGVVAWGMLALVVGILAATGQFRRGVLQGAPGERPRDIKPPSGGAPPV